MQIYNSIPSQIHAVRISLVHRQYSLAVHDYQQYRPGIMHDRSSYAINHIGCFRDIIYDKVGPETSWDRIGISENWQCECNQGRPIAIPLYGRRVMTDNWFPARETMRWGGTCQGRIRGQIVTTGLAIEPGVHRFEDKR
jgi:hypothetical protein